MAEKNEVKAGELTSEYKAAKSGSLWGIVSLILGFVVLSGAQVGVSLGVESNAGIWIGGAVALAGIIQKTLTDLGYISSRTAVKRAAQK